MSETPERFMSKQYGIMRYGIMGDYVRYDDYAILKEEIKRLKSEPEHGWVRFEDHEKLISDVNRLEKDVWRMKMLDGINEDTIKGLKAALKTAPEWSKVLDSIENNARLEAENRELKSEVELLTARNKAANMEAEEHCRRAMELRKAGNNILDNYKAHQVIFPSSIYAWNSAKNGNLSEISNNNIKSSKMDDLIGNHPLMGPAWKERQNEINKKDD